MVQFQEVVTHLLSLSFQRKLILKGMENICECMCMKILMMSRYKQHKITSSLNSRSRKRQDLLYFVKRISYW